jgi:long-chain acyl-CoA synthetase
MLTHRNLSSNVLAASRVLLIDEKDVTLSFLPLSHVFQRMVDYLLFSRGCLIAYARSIESVPEDLRTIRPTIVVSVPRLYEKVYARVTSATGVKGTLVAWARGSASAGRRRSWPGGIRARGFVSSTPLPTSSSSPRSRPGWGGISGTS